MSELDFLYKELKGYSDFDAETENPSNFLKTAEEIISKKDPESIPILFSYYDDATDYQWVFSIISKKICSYEDRSFIRSFIDCIPVMNKKAPEFLLDLFLMILNYAPFKALFIEFINTCDKKSTLEFFDFAQEEYPHRKNELDELRENISKI